MENLNTHNHKKLLAIIISIIIVVLMILLYLLLQTANVADKNPVVPTSNPNIATESTKFKFTLNAENVGTPINGKTYDYSFKSSITTDFEIESLNYSPATYILTSKEFELVVFTPAESFGGIVEANSTEEINDNKLGIPLTRVEPADQNIARDYFSEFNNEHDRVYFYGTKGGEGIGCTEDSFCGSEHIKIESSQEEHPDASLKVYCFVSSEESVSYCDEFVRNLELIDSELKIVSYPSL